MSKEGQFIAYGGEEAAALHMWQMERDEWFERWHALEPLTEGDPEAHRRWEDLEPRFNEVQQQWAHVIHCRLVRVLPHLADVLTYLIWPEFMATPEWTDERGLPMPWSQPVPDSVEAWWRRRIQQRDADTLVDEIAEERRRAKEGSHA